MPAIDSLKAELDKISSLKEMNPGILIRLSEEIGRELKEKNLKTNQIRKVLNSVRKIEIEQKKRENFSTEELIFLKPTLAYAAKRIDEKEKSRPGELFNYAISLTIDKVKGAEDFERFMKYVQSIVAYHKFYGGQD